MPDKKTALVVGVGPGLGWALAKRFAAEGMQVAVAARNEAKLAELIRTEPKAAIRAYGCDTGDRSAVQNLFERVEAAQGAPGLVVFNASSFARGSILELDPTEVERVWRVGALGGLIVGQEAARRMVKAGRGSILFTGATASVRGSANFAPFAMIKFGLRALAQSMARELGPKGIHVAHVIIDGQIASERYRAAAAERGPDALLEPDAIAEAYWQLHLQPKSAWAFELDLRPWVEKF